MKVLSFGSLNIDYVYQIDHIVSNGETESTSGMRENCGGKGLNQSIALARAGVSVWHAGMVGSEGQLLIDACVKNGVNTDFIRMTKGRSGHTIIQVDKNGNNSIILFGGANRCMTETFIDEVINNFESGDMIILQNEINLLDVIIDKAFSKGMKIVLNPSPYDKALDECDLKKVSFFILNEIEGNQMTGEKEPEKILAGIHEKYPDAKIVLTLGSEGSMYFDDGKTYRQGIYKVKAVDTTAAGDTFTGFFVASIIKGMKSEEGLSLAAKAAAIAVTKPGALDSIPALDEVLAKKL
ncbi:MAG: ribokinase [Treponemataceae bacterium]|nr:ribokinase [Treponemataceae bacterium]